MKKMMVTLALAGIVASSTGALAFGTSKFEKEVAIEASAVKLAREVQRGDYDLISTEELHKLIENGDELLIVDTMPYEASYTKNHIPGAQQFLFPIPEMTEWSDEETGGKSVDDFKALLGTDTDRKIIMYCGFVKCTRSHNGAMWARKLGYSNVLRHPGGIFAWKGADYQTDSVK